jgi:glycosyltransferase involved in cell wall biosynthesis
LGSDVLRTFLTPQQGNKGKIVRLMVKSAEKIRSPRIVNLAVADWLVSELKSQGISASCFPISTLDTETLKAPNEIEDKDIDFLSYIPKTSFAFYGGDHILRLSRELPQYTFAVIMPDITDCNALPRATFGNLRFYPRLTFEEMQNMYLRSKCFNRLTEHDGLSLSVLEALYFKLQVVWTYDFPYVIRVQRSDINELKNVLSHIIENYSQNNEGHNYVVQNFSREVCRTKFLELLRTFNRHFEN